MIEFASIFIFGFLFIFCVYALSKDDFSLFRKNVSLERMFTASLSVLLFGLFIARASNMLLVNGGQGIFLPAGVIGAGLFTIWYARWQKLPTGRTADISLLSFLLALPFGQALSTLLSQKTQFIQGLIGPVLLVLAFFVLFRLFKKNTLPEGVISVLSLLVYSCVSLFVKALRGITTGSLTVGTDEIFLIALFLLCLVFLVRIQSFLLRKGK